MGLGKKLNLSSIQNRICISFILLFTILALMVIIVIWNMYGGQQFQRLEDSIQQENNLILQQLDSFLNRINSCSNSIIINLNIAIHYSLTNELYPNISDLMSSRRIFRVLDSTMLMFNEVSQFTVLYHNGDMYRKNKRSWESSSGKYDIKNYLDQLDISTKGKWYYVVDNKIKEYFNIQSPTIFYIKTLRNTSTNQELGYIILAVDESQISSFYSNRKIGDCDYSCIYTNDKVILSSSIPELVGSNIDTHPLLHKIIKQSQGQENGKIVVFNGEKYYYQIVRLTGSGWNFLTVVELDTVMSDINAMINTIILVSIACIIVFCIIIMFISKSIAKPIKDLSMHMAGIRETLPETLPERRIQDEIATLITSFNTMIRRNNELFERFQEEQQIKRRLELALIQEQIKPHFLYNTLDTIFCLNSIGYYDKASRVTKMLADYYRLVLNTGEEWITIEKELEAISKYLEIQQIRYSGILSYNIDVADEILPIIIPKMLLQPLIENAIYHGIKPTGREGHISITGEMEDGWVHLRVVDNGIGVSVEQFNNILAGTIEKENLSFGLKSVSERLKLFYGEKSKLELEHTQPGITSIRVSIFLDSEER